MAKKFSQFPSAASISPGDSVVGLKDGANARFSFATVFSYIQALFVPTSRKVNNKALTSDITLNASDVGAVATSDVGAANGVASLDNNGKVPGTQLDLSGKQDTLTFDATPTASSTNPVQSGGVYTDVRTRVPNYGKGKNLLRNWYFVGGGTGRGVFPVNQRGVTNGVTTNNTYSIDAWKWTYGTRAGSWALNSTGLTLTPDSASDVQMFEYLENTSELNGKSIAASILRSDGTLKHGTITRNSSIAQFIVDESDVGLRIFADGNFRIYARTTQTIVAVKLELGTEQTLAHQENGVWVLNEIPDYEYELYRCITSTAAPSDTYANKSLATRQDLTSIQATGTTNTTGAAIPAGSYFYLNGVLHRAKVRIDQNATFTVNTNCEQVTDGGFNSLKAQTLVRRQTLATSITTGVNEWDVAADAVSGYKPIGIVGVQFAALPRSAVTLSQFLLDNGTNVVVAAQSTQARTSGIAVNAFVLYAKE